MGNRFLGNKMLQETRFELIFDEKVEGEKYRELFKNQKEMDSK